MLHCLVFKVPLVFALALASAEAILSQLRFFVNTFFLFLKKKFFDWLQGVSVSRARALVYHTLSTLVNTFFHFFEKKLHILNLPVYRLHTMPL